MRIAIVGLGPWGLCALERIVSYARRSTAAESLCVHIVEPEMPGVGIYDTTSPDYLIMNNACGDIRLAPLRRDGVDIGMDLHEWAVSRGYRRVGRGCAQGDFGIELAKGDFLPRRIMGEYLHDYYLDLVKSRPCGMTIELHRTRAQDSIRRPDGREEIRLENGETLVVDQVVLTLGNGDDEASFAEIDDVRTIAAYPAERYLPTIRSDCRVAVSGMGLVAIDVVMTLTQGLGGAFVEDGERVVYRPSGREPKIFLLSRSGLPFHQKSTTASQVPDRAKAFALTPEKVEELLARGPAGIDFSSDVMPLLMREMSARYYVQTAYERDGECQSERIAEQLRGAANAEDFDALVARLSERFGAFDPARLFYGGDRSFASAEEFQRSVCAAIAEEIAPSPASGPINAACETFRVQRDTLRSIVEYGRLTLDSYLDFQKRIRGNINRLMSGPPAWRLGQLLALIEAGIVRLPFGPEPSIRSLEPRPYACRIGSTRLREPYAQDVDLLIRGYLQSPSLGDAGSPLLSSLHRQGRLVPQRYADVEVGGIDVNREAHPIGRDGVIQERLWIFGAATEGALFATHYLPSPYRGKRAYEDIDRCVSSIFAAGASDGIDRETA